MPQPVQHQQVPQSSTTPHSNPPQPNRQPNAFAQLAEEVATAQAFLNNPKSQKSSARHQPVRLAPQPDEPPRQASEKQNDASPASLLPQAAVDSPARSAVRSSRAASHCPRDSSVRQAKNYLRVSRSPEFLRSTPNLQRHRRKCAICRHPERDMIEELFVRWHSPQAIANHLEDWDNVNWVSIYRHAYALGLDQVRRRNLRHFFENLLDDAINATPTFAGVLGAARALGCVTEDGRWVEPEKRILMTTVIRKEEPSSTTSTEPDVSSALPEQDVAPFASSMPEAALHQPAAAKRTPSDVPDPSSLPPCFLASSSSREIRLPLNSHKSKEKTISNR